MGPINIQQEIVQHLGVEVSVKVKNLPEEKAILVRPKGFIANRGFLVRSSLKWRTLSSNVVFEDYSQEVVDHIFGNTNSLDIFFQCVDDLKERYPKKIITTGPTLINKSQASSILLKIEESPIDITEQSEEVHIAHQSSLILKCFLVFFELEEIGFKKKGLPEGASKSVNVNKYERSAINRAWCIDHYGLKCQVCDFNFESNYGSIGKGYIHVHHITPVSKIGPDYRVNPINDLVPVCPNCHAMLHKCDPPMTVEELKRTILDVK